MALCKGNFGNLLQHWVLCGVVEILDQTSRPLGALHLIDAYAMAPFCDWNQPNQSDVSAGRFAKAYRRLPFAASTYDRSWSVLSAAAPSGYPSSAVFASALWSGQTSMLLHEVDPNQAADCQRWISEHSPTRMSAGEVFRGDWRQRFPQGVLHLNGAPIDPSPGTLLMSFDPYRYASVATSTGAGDMTPNDLALLRAAVASRGGIPTVMQLTTYNVMDRRMKGGAPASHAAVEGDLRSLGPSDMIVVVGPKHREMASFVLWWDLPTVAAQHLKLLPSGFSAWASSL